ncbi:MAG: RNase adapter RapZ, partial [Proteobacteria bacterium]|nr:RNase adapter RapZ [Pseudomonadota bacterium]
MAERRTRPSEAPGERRPVVLVTGMSGAGKTSALKALEDIGYEAVDNLPLGLLERLLEPHAGEAGALAIGIDIRTRDLDSSAFSRQFDSLLAQAELDVTLVFLDCDDDVLGRRFTETRRRHPLATDRPVNDGIRLERQRLAWLRERADLVVDTTLNAPSELKRRLTGHFGLDESRGLRLFVTSFAYRRGLPREADLVFDVRFLANPHYEPELQPLSGRDAKVADFIAADSAFAPFFGSLVAMLEGLIPAYKREGKSYLTIALGCTGGRHACRRRG